MITVLDIGTFSIKLLQAEFKDDELIFVQKFEKIINSANINETELDPSLIVASVQEIISEINLKPKKIKNLMSSLSGNNTSIKQITTIEMESNELATSLEFEAKKYIPLDGTDAILDFHIIGQNRKELDKIDLILVATSKKIIEKHHELIKKCGFTPGVFTVNALAIFNAYSYFNELPSEGVDVIIDIGHSSTTLICCGLNHRFFVRELETSGNDFIKCIIGENDLSNVDALEKLQSEGIDSLISKSENLNNEHDPLAIKVVEKTVHSNLVEELRKSLRFYMKSSNQAFFNKFYLTGGSAMTSGLAEYIADNLNVELETLPLLIKNNEGEEINLDSSFTTAFGLLLGNN